MSYIDASNQRSRRTEVKIDIHTSGFPLTDALRQHAERRLQFALSWADSQIRRSAIRLSDVNGPRGGNDKRCQIQLTASGNEHAAMIVIEEVQSDLYTAIDRAADRAGRTLARKLQRDRQRIRGQRHQPLWSDPKLDELVAAVLS